jgi:toxin YoeB
MRNPKFADEAWTDYLYWQTQDKKTLKRINQLIEAAARTPFEGLGKPEPLKGNLAGCWSRRIDE